MSRKSVPVALVMIAVLLFGIVGPVMAGTGPLNDLINSGKMSNDEVYSVHLDLSSVTQGTVTSTIYETVYETMTVQTHTVVPHEQLDAKGKLNRFFFFFRNNNLDHIIGTKGDTQIDTIIGYVYGLRKTEILTSFVGGIPECLENEPVYNNTPGSSGNSSSMSSSSTKEKTELKSEPEWTGKYLTASFKIGSSTYVFNNETQTMDVKPYVKDNRTYMPVRYLAYSLGVSPDNIKWTETSQKVTVVKDDVTVEMFIGNNTMFVNGKSVKMDVAPEITDNRTMLPARWFAEALGAEVSWDDTTRQATIKIAQTGD